MIDADLLARLEAHAAEIGPRRATAIVTAALQAGLLVTPRAAVAMILAERYEHGGRRAEYNVRLPSRLCDRFDELTAAGKSADRALARADLINAALRVGLPDTASETRKLLVQRGRPAGIGQ